VAARLIAALLLLCLSPLAPALTLTGNANTAPARCACCRGKRSCCCRHSANAAGWNSAPCCQGNCHGTPATVVAASFVPTPLAARASMPIARRTRILLSRPTISNTLTHSPLFQRPPPFNSDPA
jgi:hypothetical protein